MIVEIESPRPSCRPSLDYNEGKVLHGVAELVGYANMEDVTREGIYALFGRYDVIHFHAEGPCLFLWLPKLFGIRTVATVHGLDWQRAKWGKFASSVIMAGEKGAVRHADEIIVLSRGLQKYFKDAGRLVMIWR